MRKILALFLLVFFGLVSTAQATPPPWSDNGYYGVYWAPEFFDSTPIGPTWPGLMSLQTGNPNYSGSWIVQEPGNTISYHSWDVWTRAPASPTPYITGRYCAPQNVLEGSEWTFFVRFAQLNSWNIVGIGTDYNGTYQPAVDFWVDAQGRVYVPRPPYTIANLLQIGTIVANQWYLVGMRVNPANGSGRLGIYMPGTNAVVAEFTSPLVNAWGNTGGADNARCLYAVPQAGTNQDIYLDWIKPARLTH